ncbi:MAG: SDR family NAD(P)-dependent oxidoreductase [Planctomycetes bacterium]|nr:SDR family NAD(P)-dependent oxidoreductase [Planctomycetota bacterium]
MSYWRDKRAVVTGGSAGLGRALANVLVDRGARVAIVARGKEALDATSQELKARGGNVLAVAADVTSQSDVDRLASTVQSAWGGLDLLCHCAGRSMRGTALSTSVDEFRDLIETNFLSAVRCTQAFAVALSESHGHLVLIGSLASKVAAGYLGAYPASKFPLAAFAQQLRMEMGNKGLHALLVCPGPIARDDRQSAGARYVTQAPDVPAAAHQPGGGAKVRAIDPRWLAEKILRACEQRRAELIVPRRARLLFTISQFSPRMGDWLLRKMTNT